MSAQAMATIAIFLAGFSLGIQAHGCMIVTLDKMAQESAETQQ
jgi:hypothetical protein